MTTYRVFIGSWDDGDPDYTHMDSRGLSWDQAKELLLSRLERWRDDTCEACRAMAAEDWERLLIADPGRFVGSVEGDDYLILVEK